MTDDGEAEQDTQQESVGQLCITELILQPPSLMESPQASQLRGPCSTDSRVWFSFISRQERQEDTCLVPSTPEGVTVPESGVSIIRALPQGCELPAKGTCTSLRCVPHYNPHRSITPCLKSFLENSEYLEKNTNFLLFILNRIWPRPKRANPNYKITVSLLLG